jgi:putative ATPase
VPLHLRNAPTKRMAILNYGKGYQYAHDIADKVANMRCLPENMKHRQYYRPTGQGFEKNIKDRLERFKQLKKKP